MNYNIDSIQTLAHTLTTTMTIAIQDYERDAGKPPTMSDLETTLRQLLRQAGQEALGHILTAQQHSPVAELPCPCGGTVYFQRMRSAEVISVFGPIEYTRAYYAGCRCHHGQAPLDQRFGLRPRHVTSGLHELLALSGIAFSFEECPKWLAQYLLFDVAPNTVRAATEALGALQEARDQHQIERMSDTQVLQDRLRAPGPIPTCLYGSLDAAKVRVEPRLRKNQPHKPDHEDWRDLKVLCWYEAEPVLPARRSRRQRDKAQRGLPVLRAHSMRYACDVKEADEFGKLLWATGCAVRADLTPKLIFLGDGASWIWRLVETYYSEAVQIVDWYHAQDYLQRMADKTFSDATARETWRDAQLEALWEGHVESVITACTLHAPTSEAARRAVLYFTENAERMRYDQFRKAGYLIGSGTIESGCKQIAARRLTISGAQWMLPGVIHTAKARAAWLSGQWSELCAEHAALPLAA